ncbi:MAG: exodeoxyribonuclease III [Bacillota bacterium]|nr:exodeoxyribonuclease III [Bacillota bacterium]
MKLINWNVNGIRAALKKGFMDYFLAQDADFFCLQETKCQAGQVELELPGYHQFWNEAVRKGYSGTAIFTKHEPLSVTRGIGIEEHDQEGRVITLEYPRFYLVTVYTPNSKSELERLDYRMVWEDAFRSYLKGLETKKPVIFCGDLNVAHKEIDLKNPKTNQRSAGFTIEERDKMQKLVDAGFVDTFRHFYPDVTGAYTWWSYFGKARQNNAGWRIDYFMASDALVPLMRDAGIDAHIMGSDHCPVYLHMDEALLGDSIA